MELTENIVERLPYKVKDISFQIGEEKKFL